MPPSLWSQWLAGISSIFTRTFTHYSKDHSRERVSEVIFGGRHVATGDTLAQSRVGSNLHARTRQTQIGVCRFLNIPLDDLEEFSAEHDLETQTCYQRKERIKLDHILMTESRNWVNVI